MLYGAAAQRDRAGRAEVCFWQNETKQRFCCEVAPVWWTVDSLVSGFVVRHQFVLPLDGILWFGPWRSHASVPARRRLRPARAVAVKDGRLRPPEGLVLDGHEHAGRLAWVGIGCKALLVIDRRDIADRGMSAAAIVEALDELEDRRARLVPVLEPASVEQLARAWRRSFRTWRCRKHLRPSPSTGARPPGGSA